MTSNDKLPHWLALARHMIDRDFRESLTTTQIARTVNIHPVYLAQVFRLHYGYGVNEYLTRRRLAYACRELRLSQHSIAQIAIAAGFYDQGHFSRTFKRVMGLTPSAYRRRKRGLT